MGSHPCSVTDGDKAAIREALTAYEALKLSLIHISEPTRQLE